MLRDRRRAPALGVSGARCAPHVRRRGDGYAAGHDRSSIVGQDSRVALRYRPMFPASMSERRSPPSPALPSLVTPTIERHTHPNPGTPSRWVSGTSAHGVRMRGPRRGGRVRRHPRPPCAPRRCRRARRPRPSRIGPPSSGAGRPRPIGSRRRAS